MKKFLSCLLVCVILVSIIPGTCFTVSANDVTTPSKPKELPDNHLPYIEMPFLNGTFTGGYSNWQSSLFTLDSSDDFKTADGIMLKVDASQAEQSTNPLAFAFALSLTWEGGETYFCSSPGLVKDFGKASVPSNACSRWYYSEDGSTWNTYETYSATYVPLASNCKFGYIYIPLSSLWTRDGSTVISNGREWGNTSLCVTEALELLPEVWKFGMIRFIWSKTTINQDPNTEISEISLVRKIDNIDNLFVSQSVSVGSAFSYNLYLENIGATDTELSFAIGDRVEIAKPAMSEDGLIKYTLRGISPADADRQITATWTGVLGTLGKTTLTYTGSVGEYCRKLAANPDYAEWFNTSNLLLDYIAEQKNARNETQVFRDLANDPDQFSDIWGAAEFQFGTYPYFRVAVNAPAGVSQVQGRVNGRSEIYPIEDGFITVPIRIYEFHDKITLSCYDGYSVTEHDTMGICASNFLGDDAEASALVTGCTMLASNLQAKAEHLSRATTLAQIECPTGMMYVIQLSDGRFVIFDGGTASRAHTIALRNYLIEKSNGNRPVIACWFITHLDADHIEHAVAFMDAYSDYIDLQCVAYSFPDESEFTIQSWDRDEVKSWKETALSYYKFRDRLFEILETKYPDTERWDLRAGEIRQIADVNLHVLITANEKYPSSLIHTHNNRSVVVRATFTQNTYDISDDKTAMILGDSSGDSRGQWLINTYGQQILKSDIMQVIHHGLSGGYKPLYQAVDPEIVLWPTTQERFDSDPWCTGSNSEANFNAWLRNEWIRVRQHYVADYTTIIDMSDLSITVSHDYV
jgi:hypothetical protein